MSRARSLSAKSLRPWWEQTLAWAELESRTLRVNKPVLNPQLRHVFVRSPVSGHQRQVSAQGCRRDLKVLHTHQPTRPLQPSLQFARCQRGRFVKIEYTHTKGYEHPKLRCRRSMRSLLILAGVQAEMDELGLHGQTRDPKPARRFGLVAVRLSDGACEEFPLGGFKHTRV